MDQHQYANAPRYDFVGSMNGARDMAFDTVYVMNHIDRFGGGLGRTVVEAGDAYGHVRLVSLQPREKVIHDMEEIGYRLAD